VLSLRALEIPTGEVLWAGQGERKMLIALLVLLGVLLGVVVYWLLGVLCAAALVRWGSLVPHSEEHYVIIGLWPFVMLIGLFSAILRIPKR
jgi:uncharacterized BrkB/YihY/UPF0761 family membrane protein